MSKLPKAPLVEVICELSWIANTPQEREKFQFLLGNMYAQLKEKYPLKYNLIQTPIAGIELPLDIFKNKPIYQFRKAENDYPVYQLGPGLLSVNTIDIVYIWEDFEKEINEIISIFQKSYDFDENTNLNIALKYLDFYPFDFNNNNPYHFLADNLHLKVENDVIGDHPVFLTFATGNKVELGQFNYIINKGKILPKKKKEGGEFTLWQEGFLIETHLISLINANRLSDISIWLNNAHDYLSTKFKEMTKGKMYNSFLQ